MSNDYICDICGFSFTRLSALKSHQNKNEYCKNLKGTIIKCKICKLEFDTIILYKNHECNKIENQINDNDQSKIDDKKDNQNSEIEKYKFLINIYKDIIKKNLNINVSCLENITIEEININVQDVKKSNPNPENTEYINDKSENDTHENRMKSLLDNLENNKQYNKILIDIKNLRKELFKTLSFNDYEEYLNKNIQDIENILLTRFNDKKKCTKLLKKTISALEIRFFMRHGFENTYIEIDDIELLKLSIQTQQIVNKYSIFNQQNFINQFMNYNIALYSLHDLFDMYIPNSNHYNNLIYVNMPRSKKDNPFSFYYLESINNNKLTWKMDCRLDSLITYLITNIHTYCITLFRKIYHEIYHDNDYRDNFNDYNVLEIEGNNLINTLLISCSQYKFSNVLFDVIIKNCTKIEGENDKFNLRSDDNILKNNFIEMKYKECKISKENAIKQLFDNINNDEIQKLIN